MGSRRGRERTVSETRKTNCHFCGYLCAFLATVEDGRVTDLAPDPTRYPYDPAILRGCRRWRTNLSFLDDPDRVNHPLHRVGERGSGRWEQVSWDEALDDIATRLEGLVGQYGPQVLASMIGGPHATFWPLHRFMNLLGSPNNMGIGQICWNPRIWMDTLAFGWPIEADISAKTGCVFIWGTNPAQSDNSAFWHALLDISKGPVPLVVVDPRRTQTAAAADLWISPRPGTDGTLALSMVDVIIENDWYDHGFVERWCLGFEGLREHVSAYAPSCAAAVCEVPEERIVEAARLFSRSGPTVLISGRGIDQVGRNVVPTHRAFTILRAITGNVDRTGSCIIGSASDFIPEVDLEMSDRFPSAQRRAQLQRGITPLQSYEGVEGADALTGRFGRHLPKRYLDSAHPDLVLKAMLTGEPYPVRALIVEATNPLLTYADTHRVFEALSSLDVLVVLEYRITPTAMLADYVLPAAGAIERPVFQAHGGVANLGYGGPAAVRPYYERKTDYEILRGLALRMGQGEQWPDETLEDAFDRMLEPVGLTWETFCETGIYAGCESSRKQDQIDPRTGKPVGFATTTGKIELANEYLQTLGGEAYPTPKPLRDDLSPRLVEAARKRGGGRFDLITGARRQPYNASMFLDNPQYRKGYPRAQASMNEATATRLGVVAGDDVVLATNRGEARFEVRIERMHDNLISADYGWWYPERPPGAPDFSGMWESNVNVLTDCSLANGEELIGTWSYNALPCVAWKPTEGEDR